MAPKKTLSAPKRQTKSASPAKKPSVAAKRRLGTASAEAVKHPAPPFSWLPVLLLILLLLAGALAYLLYDKMQHETAPLATPVAQAPALAPIVQEAPPPPPSVAEMHALKTELERSYATIEKLQREVKEKETTLANETYLREKLFLKHYANVIRTHIEQGTPFFWELQQISNFAGETYPEIAQLAASLKTYENGNPSLMELEAEFTPLSLEAIQAWKSSQAGSGVSAKMAGVLNQLVAVRRIGMVEGDTPEAIIARTEYYLKARQLPKAVEELNRLQGKYAEIARPWRDKAETHLQAQALAEQLEKAIQLQTRTPGQAEAKAAATPIAAASAVTAPAADDLAVPAPSEIVDPNKPAVP